VLNKCDLLDLPARFEPAAPVSQDLLDSMLVDTVPTITLSAKTGQGMDLLRQYLAQVAQTQALAMAHSVPHLNHNREWSQGMSDPALDESLDN
jgi:selenocysteine-specific translation elongation factor